MRRGECENLIGNGWCTCRGLGAYEMTAVAFKQNGNI